MSHRYRKQPASTRMYRHFAVITVAVTGLLALFAEGEKAEAVARKPDAQHRQETVPGQSEAKAATQPTVQQPGGIWGDDGAAFAGPSFQSTASSWWPELSSRGYAPDYLARLSDEERRALEAAIAENTGSSLSGNRAELASLEAASAARSGSAGRD